MDRDILEKILHNAKETSIKKLSDDEIIEMVGETEENLGKELTGYGKQDRPYRQYFDKEVLEKDFPKARLSTLALKKANEMRDTVAYRCDRSITFGDLVDNSVKFAYALKHKFNVEKGDIIVMCTPSVPESIYAFFAANLIGATVRPIDPMSKSDAIEKCMVESNSKHLIALDLTYPQFKNITDADNERKVIYLPIKDSLPFTSLPKKSIISLMESISKLRIKFDSNDNWISFDETIEGLESKNIHIEDVAEPYVENENVAIFQTSGSTGKSKGVVTTNENFLSSAFKQLYSEFDIDEHDSMFNPMPPSSSYFWYDIVLAIVWGVTTSLSPLFDPINCTKEFLKDESSVILLGPLLLERICDYVKKEEAKGRKVDFSGKHHLISGGDLLELSLEQETNMIMKKTGSVAIVENALGTSETCGPALNPNGVLKNKKIYSEGSVGVVFPGNDMAVFAYDEENNIRRVDAPDYDDGLMYYEIGEICYNAANPNVFKEYYKDEESTNSALVKHTDGSKWYHTGDLGYLDPSGHVFFAGRKSGLIIRDGHKVWAPKIENVVKSVEGVVDCAVIGVASKKDKEAPACFVVYDSDVNPEMKQKIEQGIYGKVSAELDSMRVPTFYQELDSIPRNLMMKAKIHELEEIYKQSSKDTEKKSGKTLFKRIHEKNS